MYLGLIGATVGAIFLVLATAWVFSRVLELRR